MTKVTMPEPVGLTTPESLHSVRGGENALMFWSVSMRAEHEVPLYAADQMEAYAAAKVREALAWQPIETAPKDGSMILLGRPESEAGDQSAISVPGFWQEGWEDSIDDMGCDSGFIDVHFQEFSCGRSFGAEKYRCAPSQPTHWMPLPSPPQHDNEQEN